MAKRYNIDIPKVTVRKRKLRTDTYSLYLDIIYNGTRKRENLELYIIPEISRKEKIQNMKTYATAAKRRDQREYELMNGEKSSEVKFDTGVLFLEYFRNLMKNRESKYSVSDNREWQNCYNYIKRYCDETTTFNDITPDWCEGFKTYLDSVERYSHKTVCNPNPENFRGLSSITKYTYVAKLNICIKTAFEENIIPTNPMKSVKNYTIEDKSLVFLTWDEVKRLDNTPCHKPTLKNMFLLSCFTGIRRKDMEKMTWGDIDESDNLTTVTISDKTPTGYKVIIPEQAKKYLGQRGNHDDLVFPNFKYNTFIYVDLRQWALVAGVMKDLTFISARRTFAVLLILLGADIYTVASMLGRNDMSHMDEYVKLASITKNKEKTIWTDKKQ